MQHAVLKRAAARRVLRSDRGFRQTECEVRFFQNLLSSDLRAWPDTHMAMKRPENQARTTQQNNAIRAALKRERGNVRTMIQHHMAGCTQ